MEQVISSCNAAANYPQNLIQSSAYEFVANSYLEKLDEHQRDLFGAAESAALDFWELSDTSRGTSPRTIV